MKRLASFMATVCLGLAVLAHPLAQAAALPLNGAGIHYAVTEEIYIAGLYLPKVAKTADEALGMEGPKRMEMRVVTESIRSRSFATLWLQLININNSPEDVSRFTDEIQQFSNVLEDKLVFGDSLTIDLDPGKGVTVAINGVPVQHYRDDAFFNILLRCWVGSRSPSNDFTKNLLGRSSDNADIIDRFDVTLPESGRKQAIAAWTSASALAAAAPKAVAVAPKPAPKPAPVATPKPAPKPEVVAKPEPKPEPATVTPEPAIVAAPKPAVTAEPEPEPAIAAPEPGPAVAAAPEPEPTPEPKPVPVITTPEPKPAVVAAAPAPKPEPAPAATEEPAEAVDTDALRKTYRAYILRDTYKKVRYPQSAVSRNQEGEVVVNVTVKRDGSLVDADITKRSYPALNTAATKAIGDAAPFPAAPDELPGDTFTFEIPIKFKVPH